MSYFEMPVTIKSYRHLQNMPYLVMPYFGDALFSCLVFMHYCRGLTEIRQPEHALFQMPYFCEIRTALF